MVFILKLKGTLIQTLFCNKSRLSYFAAMLNKNHDQPQFCNKKLFLELLSFCTSNASFFFFFCH